MLSVAGFWRQWQSFTGDCHQSQLLAAGGRDRGSGRDNLAPAPAQLTVAPPPGGGAGRGRGGGGVQKLLGAGAGPSAECTVQSAVLWRWCVPALLLHYTRYSTPRPGLAPGGGSRPASLGHSLDASHSHPDKE